MERYVSNLAAFVHIALYKLAYIYKQSTTLSKTLVLHMHMQPL